MNASERVFNELLPTLPRPVRIKVSPQFHLKLKHESSPFDWSNPGYSPLLLFGLPYEIVSDQVEDFKIERGHSDG